VVDDKCLEIDKECDRELQLVRQRYEERKQSLYEERRTILAGSEPAADRDSGTPALRSFWCTALRNNHNFEECIQEWDEPVLEYLSDITAIDIPEASLASNSTSSDKPSPNVVLKGLRLEFHFVPNPYFEETLLWKESYYEEDYWSGESHVKEMKAAKITWKLGKDITVHLKKPKNNKKKKDSGVSKNSKGKEEPRRSFFRDFFRNLTVDDKLPYDLDRDELLEMLDLADDDEDDEELVAQFLDFDYDLCFTVQEQIVKYAVRWYTGEAAPDDDDFSIEGEESEEDSDVDESGEDDDKSGGKGKTSSRGRTGKPKDKPEKAKKNDD